MSNNGMDLPDIDIDLRDDSITAFGGGGGGPKLPVGTYTMEVAHAEQGTSKKGAPTCKVNFKVIDEGEFFGVNLNKVYSLQTRASREGGTPAIGRFKNLMMAAGCDLDKIRLSQLVGSRVIVDISHEAGQDRYDAQGNVQPGAIYCEVRNERALPVEEPPAPPPPVTKAKPATAARRA